MADEREIERLTNACLARRREWPGKPFPLVVREELRQQCASPAMYGKILAECSRRSALARQAKRMRKERALKYAQRGHF